MITLPGALAAPTLWGTMKRSIRLITAIALLGLLGFCAFKIISGRAEAAEEKKIYESLAVFPKETEAPAGASAPVAAPETVPVVTVFDLYPSMTGWITIPDTNVDYPVMETPAGDPDYYLTHNVLGQESRYGCPFIQADCDLMASDCVVIYGHHIKDGSMFADLDKFTGRKFYDEHPEFTVRTRGGALTCKVLTVFKTSLYDDDSFEYYKHTDFADEAEFDAFWDSCRALSLFEPKGGPEYGDRLVLLSTCEYSRRDGRLVVVAKIE